MQLKHRGLADVGWGGCFLHLALEGNLLTPRRDPNKLETLRLKPNSLSISQLLSLQNCKTDFLPVFEGFGGVSEICFSLKGCGLYSKDIALKKSFRNKVASGINAQTPPIKGHFRSSNSHRNSSWLFF